MGNASIPSYTSSPSATNSFSLKDKFEKVKSRWRCVLLTRANHDDNTYNGDV